MPRTWALLLILLMFLPGLYAQEWSSEDEPDTSIEEDDSEWEKYSPSIYAKGDKTFIISLGTLFPTYFSGITDNKHGIRPVGGIGSLSFCYFLTPRIFVGGELSGMFIPTRGGNMFYMIPMGARVGYQFVIKRFEIPLTLMIGGAPQLYLEENYFGLFFKAGAALYWRFSPDWSFGLNTFWWLVPQWPKEGTKTTGNFVELTLSARYHF